MHIEVTCFLLYGEANDGFELSEFFCPHVKLPIAPIPIDMTGIPVRNLTEER